VRLIVFALAAAIVLVAGGSLFAEESVTKSDPPRDPFVLDWWSTDGGGGPASGGDFELLATIGQHDAGFAIGGDYVFQGGFLAGGDLGLVFADGFENGTTDRWDNTVGGR